MANIFTLKSSSYDGRYMELVCTQTPSDSNNNYSTINWTFTTKGGSVNYYSTGPTKVIINGQTVYSLSRVAWDSYKFPAKKGSVSGTLTVGHENDGSKSIDVSFSTAIKVAAVGTYSGTWALDSIPRYANITSFSVWQYDETSVKYGFGTDVSCDWARYSLDNVNWYDLPMSELVTGLSPNTSYTFYLAVRRTDSGLWSYSSGVSQTTYDYPKPTSLNHFTIGDGATVYLYNPLGRNCTLELISKVSGSVIGTYQGTYQGSVNAEFKTAEAIAEQYASIPNAQSGGYYAKVTYGSSVKTLDWNGVYSIKGTEVPIFSNFTYKDTWAGNITGNNQVLIQKVSGLTVTIPSANKMVTVNGATPQYYVVSIDSQSVKVNFSNDDITVNLPSIDSAGIKRLNVRAYDSRGLSTLVYKDVTYIDYDYPVLNVDISRLNNFEEQTTLKISGTYSRLTIDGEDKNTITKLWYNYRETGGTWGNPKYLSFTASNGKYTCDNDLLMLDREKSYEFEIWVCDSLDENDATFTVDVGKPIFMISSNKKECYINGNRVLTENDMPVDYIVEQGTSGIWTYRKWASGIAECWGRAVSTTSPEWDSNSAVCNVDLPFQFIGAPIVNCSGGQFSAHSSYVALSVSEATYVSAYVKCPQPPSDTYHCWFYFDVKGKWK